SARPHRAPEGKHLAARGRGESGRPDGQRGGDDGDDRGQEGMMAVHPTAVVDRHAELHSTVEVGPYAVIGPKVKIGARTRVGAHAVIEGDTTIGEGNVIFQFAAIGAIPQDMKYAGEATRLVMGNSNQVREFATVHIGTAGGGGVTRVGNHCLL